MDLSGITLYQAIKCSVVVSFQGMRGTVGSTGARGLQGSKGMQGNKGYRGPHGPFGEDVSEKYLALGLFICFLIT